LLRIRDRRSGLETLRSIGEIRTRGLFVELDAYRCLVLDELREVASSDAEPWSDLAARLGGGWVPSLDAELGALVSERRRGSAAGEATGRPSIEPRSDSVFSLSDGRRMAVAEWGEPAGMPVFLLHGMPGSRVVCPDEPTTLARGVRLITIDRPGYGRSDPQPGRRIIDGGRDVAAVAGLLGLDRYAVVGWSSGGAYALAAAVADPTRVSAVAVVAGDAPTREHPDLLEALPPHIRDRLRRIEAGDPSAVDDLRARLVPFVETPEQMLADDPDPTDTDTVARARPGVSEALTAMFREAVRQGDTGWVEDWLATFDDWGFRLADVARPVAVWRGDRDGLSSAADSERLAASVPGAVLRVVRDAGHSVAFTNWAEILDSVLPQVEDARP